MDLDDLLFSCLCAEEIPSDAGFAKIGCLTDLYFFYAKLLCTAARTRIKALQPLYANPDDCYDGLLLPSDAELRKFAHSIMLRGDKVHVDVFCADPFTGKDGLDAYLRRSVS